MVREHSPSLPTLGKAFRGVGGVDPSIAQPRGQAAPSWPLLPVQLAVEKKKSLVVNKNISCVDGK